MPKKSGPNTRNGRAVASRNAVKHGILSPHPVIIEDIETIEDWDQFEAEIVESWATQGRYEQELAERIAYHLWRLRRCRHQETAVLNHQVQRTEDNLVLADAHVTPRGEEIPYRKRAEVVAYQQLRIIPSDLFIDLITRYEMHVQRLFVQTVHELEACQARRRGDPVTLGRHDFNSIPNLGPHRSPAPQIPPLLAADK